MTTELLFRADAYLTSCAARVTGHMGEDGVQLDRTVFYPSGGGQPGDTGILRWPDGEATVTDTVKGENGAAIHRVAGARPPVGAEVEAILDWDRRYAHMRMHTALHLLSVAIPLPVTGGQIGAERGRLDFDMPDAPEDKAALEAALNALIAGDHPVGES